MLNFLAFLLAVFLSAQQALYGVILGLVQGIAEWLPISSKTQIIVVSTYLFKLTFNEGPDILRPLHGDRNHILAAVIYFRKELYSLILYVIGKGER